MNTEALKSRIQSLNVSNFRRSVYIVQLGHLSAYLKSYTVITSFIYKVVPKSNQRDCTQKPMKFGMWCQKRNLVIQWEEAMRILLRKLKTEKYFDYYNEEISMHPARHPHNLAVLVNSLFVIAEFAICQRRYDQEYQTLNVTTIKEVNNRVKTATSEI